MKVNGGMRLNPCAFIVAGFIFISVSPLVNAAHIVPEPNPIGSTISDQSTVSTAPVSNGGMFNLDSALTLTNSSGSILNVLDLNLNSYGVFNQLGQSTLTFFTVPDSLTPMNTSSID